MMQTTTPSRADDARIPAVIGGRPPLTISPAIVFTIIAIVIFSALTSFLISLTQERVYGAQTEIIFDPGPGLSDAAANRALLTQEAVLRSLAVLGPVSNEMKISVVNLSKSLEVDVVGQSNVFRLTVLHPDPGTARLLAEMITSEYEHRLVSLNSEYIQRETQSLKQRIDQLSASLRDVQSDLGSRSQQRPPGQPVGLEEQQLSAFALTLQRQIENLQSELTMLEPQQFPQPVVLTPVYVLDGPVRPRPIQATALGALTGIFIAAGAVLVLMWTRSARSDVVGIDDQGQGRARGTR